MAFVSFSFSDLSLENALMRIARSPGRLTAFTQEDANGFPFFRIEGLANKTRLISAHLAIWNFFVQAYGQEVHWQPSFTTACKIGMTLLEAE